MGIDKDDVDGRVTMRLGRELVECLDYVAAENGRDRSWVARVLLKKQLGIGMKQYEKLREVKLEGIHHKSG